MYSTPIIFVLFTTSIEYIFLQCTFSETWPKLIEHFTVQWPNYFHGFLSRVVLFIFCPIPSHPLVFFYFLHDKCIIPPSFFQLLWSWLLSPALSSRVFVSVVLAVCQMYPGLQISHVEEASSPATILGWCKKGWGHCQTRSFIVVPYRCLGESQTHPKQFVIQTSHQECSIDPIYTALSHVLYFVVNLNQ